MVADTANPVSSDPPTDAPTSHPQAGDDIDLAMYVNKAKKSGSLKDDGTKYVPTLKLYLKDEDKKPVLGVDIVVAWNTTKTAKGNKTKSGFKPATTKKKGKAVFNLPKIPIEDKMDVTIHSVTDIDGFVYTPGKNKKYMGCRYFSDACRFIEFTWEG